MSIDIDLFCFIVPLVPLMIPSAGLLSVIILVASSAVCSWVLSALFTLLLWLEIVGIDCGNPPMRSKGSTLGAREYC
jgi:hypothetical protein